MCTELAHMSLDSVVDKSKLRLAAGKGQKDDKEELAGRSAVPKAWERSA